MNISLHTKEISFLLVITKRKINFRRHRLKGYTGVYCHLQLRTREIYTIRPCYCFYTKLHLIIYIYIYMYIIE